MYPCEERYSETIRDIGYDLYSGTETNPTVSQICTNVAPVIFNSDWTIYGTSEDKLALECKIMKHFWLRQIGSETRDIFLFYLNQRLSEIMPYYNEMYKALEDLEYPLDEIEMRYTNSSEGKSKGVSSSSYRGKTDSESKNESAGASSGVATSGASDTPVNGLQGVNSYTYLSSAARNDSKSNTSAHGSSSDSTSSVNDNSSFSESDSTTTGTSRESGRRTPKARLIDEYIQAVRNVDMMVIKDLNDLFMWVYCHEEMR